MKTAKTANPVRAVLRGVLLLGVAVGLSGCGAFSWVTSRFSSETPESAPPAAPAAAPPVSPALGAADPVPRNEPLHPTANKWYGANGRLYRPITDDRSFKERGRATVIGADQEGRSTASGESFAPTLMTAAHPTLPIPSYARVTDLRTSRTAIVRINDRGAYDRDEAIAISPAVAQRIGLTANDQVEVERITPAEIASMPAPQPKAAAAPPPPAPPPPPVAVAAPQATPAPAEVTPLPPQAVAPAPAPAPAPAAAAPAAPAAAAVAPAAAPRAVPAPAPRSTAPGAGWSVQVAAFAVESLAQSTRARVAQQLAQSLPDAPAPRVERHGNRSYVLVGDFAHRDAAETLAGRLRAVLRQDVVVERR
jgi:rare lipoprotein A